MPSINIKLLADTTDLEAKLSKTQKELGVHYDQYGRLINKEGQFVAGLSQARIRMGDYVDAMGQVRNANGDLMEGLSGVQQKLRMYIDEMGNVRTVSGDFVSLSKERMAALDEEGQKAVEQAQTEARAKEQLRAGDAEWTSQCRAEAEKRIAEIQKESKARIDAAQKAAQAEKASQSLGQALSGLGGTAGNIAQVVAILGQTGDGASRAAQMVSGVAQAVQVFGATAKSINAVRSAMAAMTAATEAQTVAQTALNLVSGNWIALAGAGIAAAATAVGFFTSKTEESTKKVVESTNATDALTYALQKYGTTIQAVGAERAGFMTETLSDLDRVHAAQQRVADETANVGEAMRNYAKSEASDEAMKALREAREAKSKSQEDLANTIATVWAKDADNDPLAELKARAQVYSEILESGALEGEELANAQKALANNLEKQDEEIRKQALADAQGKGWGNLIKEKEKDPLEGVSTLDEAVKKAAADLGEGSDLYKIAVANLTDEFNKRAEAEAKAARETAQKALGSDFDQYAQKTLSAEEELEATIRRWRENAAAAGRSEEELSTAIDALQAEYQQKQRDQFLQDKDISGLLEEPARGPKEEYEDAIQKLADAADLGLISAEEKDRALNAAKDRYAQALDDAAKKEEQQKNQRLSELGMSGYRDKVKSKDQKMDEAVENAKKAVAEGLLDQAEADKIVAQKRQEIYADEIRDAENRQKEWERAMSQTTPKEEKLAMDKHGGVTEMQSASQALYKAVTSNNESYQSAVKKQLGTVAGAAAETNGNLEQLNAKISQFFESIGII